MRVSVSLTTALIALVGYTACGNVLSPGPGLQAAFQFSQGAQGWQPGDSDYSPDESTTINFVADVRPLQAPLSTTATALFMSSANRSDDLFMFWKGHFVGLAPGASYTARFTVELASGAGTGCGGIGGAPGESVFVKAGASLVEPLAALNSSGQYQMNIDKGNQSMGGTNAIVLGNIATGAACGSASDWRLKQLASGSNGVTVQAGSDGGVWLLVGTDSGFEGATALYVTRFQAAFEQQ